MAQDSDIMSLLFGKKRRRKRTSTTKKKTSSSKKKVKVGYCIKQTKSGKNIVNVYKIQGRSGRFYYNGRACKKKVYKHKTKAKAALKRMNNKSSFGRRRSGSVARRRSGSVARRRRRRSSFGTGGNYMPLSSIMSPVSSVNAGSPWI